MSQSLLPILLVLNDFAPRVPIATSPQRFRRSFRSRHDRCHFRRRGSARVVGALERLEEATTPRSPAEAEEVGG